MSVSRIMRICKTEIELWAYGNRLELDMTNDDLEGVGVVMDVAHVVELRNYLNECIDSLYLEAGIKDDND